MSNLFANCTVAVQNIYAEDDSGDEDLPDGGGVIIVKPTMGEEVDPIMTEPPPPGGFPTPGNPTIGFPQPPTRAFVPGGDIIEPDILIANPFIVNEIEGVPTHRIICEPGGIEPVDAISFSWLSDTTNTTLIDYWSSNPNTIPSLVFGAGAYDPPSLVIPSLPQNPDDLAFYQQNSSLWNQTRIAGSFDIRYVYQQPDMSYDVNSPDLARIRVSVYTNFTIDVTDSPTEDPTWEIEYPDSAMALQVPGTTLTHPTTWSISNGTIIPSLLSFSTSIMSGAGIDISITEEGVISVTISPTADIDWSAITNPQNVFFVLGLNAYDSDGNLYATLDNIFFDVTFPDGLFDDPIPEYDTTTPIQIKVNSDTTQDTTISPDFWNPGWSIGHASIYTVGNENNFTPTVTFDGGTPYAWDQYGYYGITSDNSTGEVTFKSLPGVFDVGAMPFGVKILVVSSEAEEYHTFSVVVNNEGSATGSGGVGGGGGGADPGGGY
jgi:hypothetical protein